LKIIIEMCSLSATHTALDHAMSWFLVWKSIESKVSFYCC